MNKIFGVLLAATLVLGALIVTASPVSADGTTVDVPGDFSTIQEAVDAAKPGDTIRVEAGEYEAFLVLEKTNISIIGEVGTVVTSADSVAINRGPIEDAWTMAAVKDSQNIEIQGIEFDGTALSGHDDHREVVVGVAYVDSTGRITDVTADNIAGTQLGVGVAVIGDAGASVVNLLRVTVSNCMAGVIIWDAEASLDACITTGMKPNGGFGIMDRGVGIVIGIPGLVWSGPSTVSVKGSTISDNGIGIFVCDGSTLEARFNNIFGNAALGVVNDGAQTVDAIHNWWGDAAGPFGPEGNAVSEDVGFIPWTPSRTVTETVTNRTVDARQEADTEVDVKGTATVTVAKYAENPGEPSDATLLHKWVDVYAPDTGEVEEIEIRLHYTADEVGDVSELVQRYLRLFWWDGDEWKECSDSGVNTTSRYMWARIRADTTPSLADLHGMPVDGGVAGPTPPSGPCGGGWSSLASVGLIWAVFYCVSLRHRYRKRAGHAAGVLRRWPSCRTA